MKFNEDLCSKYLDDNKIYSAHIVTRVMRNDLIVGFSKLPDWISHLRSDDLYLIIRSLEDLNDDEVYHDIIECMRLMLYVENGKEVKVGNEKNTVHDLLIFLKGELNTRTGF